MGQEMLREKLTQRLSKDTQGVIRTLKSAGVKLSQQEEASISRGSLDQFSDAQLGERFNPRVLGMLGISTNESAGSSHGKPGANPYSGQQGKQAQQGKQPQQKTDTQDKKQNRNK